MTMNVCTLFSRSLLSLFNFFAFAFFVCLTYFIDQENKYFFKWILGNTTSLTLTRHYEVSLSPAWWNTYVCYAVYAWQGLWMVFSVSLLFRKNFPDAMNSLFYIICISSSGLEIAWIVFVSRVLILPACIAIFCAAFSKAFALGLAYVRFDAEYDVEEHTMWVDFWGFQLLVFNGIASYVVVIWYNSLMWLSITLTYQSDIPEISSTTIALTLALTSMIIWFILENTLFLWTTRFTLNVYPILIITLVASLHKNWDPHSRNSAILAVFLCLACLFFVVRIVRVTLRMVKAKRSYNKAKPRDSISIYNIEFMTTRF